MRDDTRRELLPRLKADYGLKEKGVWLREGKCPSCGKKELYASAEKPWVLRCGRESRCGETFQVKTLYPEIFDNWSKRHPKTEANPTAAADAYLRDARGFDLQGLRAAYAQEWYQDQKLGIGSATVRFALPGGGYWERLIDQPGRFGKRKANFSYGTAYRGRAWHHPADQLETFARAEQLWFAEGIFDTLSLRSAGRPSASLMSCNNWPEQFLAELRAECGRLNVPGPRLIFAFDVGAAGVRFTRKFVAQAREAGWRAGAAQVRPDGEGDKLDWNDLWLAGDLNAEKIEEALWNGDLTIAPSAAEKAFLIYQRHKTASFPITFAGRQHWATFPIERIQQALEMLLDKEEGFDDLPYEEQWHRAAREAVEISEIANCIFRTLYFQRDAHVDEGGYFFRIELPAKSEPYKAVFTGGHCSAGAEFKKRLASVAPGAQWTGTTLQLDKLMQRQWSHIRMVEAVQFTGYSIDHGAWLLGDVAVWKGRVYDRNEEDYFTLGNQSVKTRTADHLLSIAYDPDKLDLDWIQLVRRAWGPKGLVVVAFWCLAFFAEQIRAEQKSLAFLEVTGLPGTGKSTLLEFLWKTAGRENYEGFDPTKATNAAIARTFGQVSNLPVVLIEGDRRQDTPHAKRFDWDELKTAYNGRAVRVRGIANGGMETFEPPFRGAIIIGQNYPVEASPALLERIMGLHFDKSGWSPDTKAAAQAVERVPIEQVSGFVVHIARREAEILKAYREAFQKHDARLTAVEGIRNGRLVKNHAQLAAMLDAMRIVVAKLDDRDVADAQQLIAAMVQERQRAIESDHPVVELFWERFDYIQQIEASDTDRPINHSRVDSLIAVNLVQFEQRCGELRLHLPPMTELRNLLKTSKARKFVEAKSVNSRTGKTVNCWVFAAPPTSSPQTKGR